MTKDRLRVTVLQPELRWLHPMPNMHALRQGAERIAQATGPDILVLPEAFLGLPAELEEDGRTADLGKQFLSTLAKATHVTLVGGTIEHRGADGRVRNTCFVVSPTGDPIARYDKRILFALEADSRAAGASPCVFDLGPWRIGVLICADLWHPELARELMHRVDLLCVPIKSSVPSERHVSYARSMWETLALTRAMESGLAVATSDWAEGRHQSDSSIRPLPSPVPQTHYTAGAASVANPAHRPDMDRIQQTLPPGRPGHLTLEIDRTGLETFRAYRKSVGLLPESEDV